MAIKILLDPGHGAGKAHNRGSVIGNEGDNNYHFSIVLKNELEKRGFIVGTTRQSISQNPSLQSRGQKAKGYDLFLSLHSNANNNKNVRGTEIFPDTNPVKNWHKLAV
ncbi:MAG TPA: N-acetylmuramoyl-L-alanine amidase, partial [Candidatus Merdenecus merdavium]|nr:N-acetylmuramoyl-L-alanine amidase [Candidatus Merdenecus merdavium]